MIDVKKFLGIMNLDDKEEDILPGQHINALNLRFYGSQNGMTAQNVPGNSAVNNPYIPAGDNQCIGAFFDQLKQRIFWLNWNSNASHGIYMYDLATQTVTPLLVCFTNSQTDILGFDLDYPATDIHIIYTTDQDGDILDWNTRNKRPKTLNLLDAINNRYGSNWIESYLDVAKEPPSIPIKCAYEDDNTVTVNNLRKKLFRFKYRYWYKDNEKSTWSAISEIPVPFMYADPQVDTDPTKNCRIGCVIQTGDDSVTKIEIAAQESEINVFSNFFSVSILEKSTLSIPSNDVYVYRFYNNEAYVFIDLDESILMFDYVPDKANAQSLLNGNVRVYGGIEEGLDPVVPDALVTTDIEYSLAVDCNNIFSVTQYGLEGFSSGNIHFIVLGNISIGQTFNAYIQVGVTTYTITYTSQVGDTASDVITGLSSSATGQGFTQVSISANELIIIRTNQVLLRHSINTTSQSLTSNFDINSGTNTIKFINGASYISLFYKGVSFYILGSTLNLSPFTVVSSAVNGSDLDIVVNTTQANETIASGTLYFQPQENTSIPAYNSSSKENLGIMYFNEKGKTNGVTTSPDFNMVTKPLGIVRDGTTLLFYVPYAILNIYHQPPLWAKYFHIVRTSNLTKQASIDWITSGTYKDSKYAYISIESINAYKKINTSSVISYEFSPGDRIKFYILYNPDATPNTVYHDQHDYEIYDGVTNPDINGVIRNGQFVKILLPETDSTFDFGNGRDLEYNNYYIELYTPAKSATKGLDVYYEFSERYEVGNPGLSTRFHQGQLQNQNINTSSPATYKLDKGDWWFRFRSIEIGDRLSYDLVPGIFYSKTVLGQKKILQTYVSTNYTAVDEVQQQNYVNVANSPGWTINELYGTVTFHVTGQIIISVVEGTPNFWQVSVDTISGSGAVNNNTLYSQTGANAGDIIVITVDKYVTVAQDVKTYLVLLEAFPTTGPVLKVSLVSGNLNYTLNNTTFKVGVVDQNFSDFYESKVNSDGRSDTVHPDEKTTFFGTLVRWGRAYQQNTNINQINRFYPTDFDEIDRSKGDIQRLVSRDRTMRVFQNRAVGKYGVYARFIQNNQGDSQLVTTNDILTKNNISYYSGEFGLGDQYAGLVSANRVDYFADPVRGYHVRVSDDGMTPISELYKGQFYIRNLILPYNQTHLRPDGSKAKIIGCYNYFDEEYNCILQEAVDLTPYTFSFNERRNAYSSFFSYHPEWMLSAESTMYSWKDGNLWIHNNTTSYCNFYGSQYGASITVVFNINLLEKKTWESISEISSAIWKCPYIYTNSPSYSGQVQQTNLIEQDFSDLEGVFEAAILRDQNSIGGILNGDFIKGNYLCVTFQKDSASGLITLTEAKVMYKDSPITSK